MRERAAGTFPDDEGRAEGEGEGWYSVESEGLRGASAHRPKGLPRVC